MMHGALRHLLKDNIAKKKKSEYDIYFFYQLTNEITSYIYFKQSKTQTYIK